MGPGEIFLCTAAFWVAIFIYYYSSWKNYDAVKKKIHDISTTSTKQTSVRDILELKYNYYKNLPSKELKELFVKRVDFFIKTKEFISKEDDFVITEDMKILVAATATQLTFGLSINHFKRFRRIYLFKGAYYSNRTKKHHKGEVSPRGYIALSWEDFEKGFETTQDRLNVGLHEMAHALKLDIIFYSNSDSLRGSFMENVVEKAFDEVSRINSGKLSFFRKYAAKNKHEFFAVAVEHFFEAPRKFKTLLPSIYKYMCLVLNQDPLNNIYKGIKTDDHFPYSNEANTFQTMREEPLYKTRVKPHLIIMNYIGYILTILFFFSLAEIDITDTESIGFIFSVVSSIILIYVIVSKILNKLVVFKNYLLVKNYGVFNLTKSIHLSNIVSINLETSSSSTDVEITYIDNKKFKNQKARLYSKVEDIYNLTNVLLKNNILVRSDGEKVKRRKDW